MKSEIGRPVFPEEQELASKFGELATLHLFPAFSSAASFPTLQDAIASSSVTAGFRGTGGSSGDSVMAELAKGPKAGPEPLEALLPAGSVLVSDDPDVQNMMVASVRGILRDGNKYQPQTRIVLPDSGTAVYVLAGYCLEFLKENPSQDTGFRLERPDPALARIAEMGASLTVPGLQAAVWMLTDGVTFDRMNQKFPISLEDWSAGEAVFLECRGPAAAKTNAKPTKPTEIDNEDENVSVQPADDARLPILEAEIESHWLQYRKAFVSELRKENRLEKTIKATALDCVKLLHHHQEKGHHPDQAREAMWAYLIHPRQD
jgi:hypothetical protein